MLKGLLSLITPLKDTQPDEFNAFKLLDTNINGLLARIQKLEAKNQRYFCNVQHSFNQTVLSNGVLNFNTTIYPQYGNMHDNVNNNDKVYIRRNGVYHIDAGFVLAPSAGGTYKALQINLTRNGATLVIASDHGAAVNLGLVFNAGRSYYLYKDDIIQVTLLHDVGGTLLINGGDDRTFLSVSERMEDLDPSQFGVEPPMEK